MSFVESQKKILESIGLQVEENNLITDTKNIIKTSVQCNQKSFFLNSGHIPLRNEFLLLNLTSKKKDCSAHLIKKHISAVLSSKIDVVFSYLIKFASNPELHNENNQELNQLVLSLHEIDNSSAEDIVNQNMTETWSKLYGVIKNKASQDILIKMDAELKHTIVDDSKTIESYNNIYNVKNEEVDYIRMDLFTEVSFPLYRLLKVVNDNKLLGVTLSKKEIEILKTIYRFIFEGIDKTNSFRFPKKTLWKDNRTKNHKPIIVNSTPVAHPIMLMKTFVKLANKIDCLLDKLSVVDESIKQEMFNLAITEEMLDKFEKDNMLSLDFEHSSNLTNEIRRAKAIDIEVINKNLNDKSSPIKVVPLDMDTAATKEVKGKGRRPRKANFISMIQPSILSSIRSNLSSLTLDPTDSNFDILIPPEELLKHTHVSGASGVGKTELVKSLVNSKIKKGDSSVVVFDPHGDFALEIAKGIQDKKRLILINPFMHKDKIPTIDPFKTTTKDEELIALKSQELLSAFEIGLGIEWSINMTAVLIPCISTILREDHLGIFDLQRFMDPNNNADLIKLGKKSPVKGHRIFFKSSFNMDKYEVTKDAIGTKLQVFLNDEKFANLISGENKIDVEKEINTPGQILIFQTSKAKMKNTMSLYNRLMMATIQGIILKREKLSPHLRPQTFLYLDEFQHYIGVTIEEILTDSRKYGCSVTLIHQSISQLDSKLKSIILSCTNIKLIGKNSYENLRILSKEIQVDVKEMENLNVGEFFLKVGSIPAVKIMHTTKFLGNKNAISSKKWKKHLKYLTKHYYRPIEDESLQTMNNAEFKQTLETEVLVDESSLVPFIDEF
ncbi:type IV secretory system conjugative DNA transfer family protein [Candidatus Sulfurimonas baltica]|uniref:Type IV secretion system DNA-binding domain-containing protein n=1 Tax=Candidatus Sulfurimonas baltica TaxID=2740404 RepID=A0A7S7LV30_9BACT|nr:type IV secretion system DNA-binding domain-containing protein [Candidatus Sulfurimonas baltica]QOY51976.1 type IV secretion system DNA-binding domain-containing protein [Candidatus Sulfurimonas baltica]